MASPGAIAGIIIGSIIAFLVLLTPLIWITLRRRRTQHAAAGAPNIEIGTHSPQKLEDAKVLSTLPPRLSIESDYVQLHNDSRPTRPQVLQWPVNWGSMQVKGIRNIGGDRESSGQHR